MFPRPLTFAASTEYAMLALPASRAKVALATVPETLAPSTEYAMFATGTVLLGVQTVVVEL